MNRPAAGELIQKLGLQPLTQEGGMYAISYRDPNQLGGRTACGAIYFLLSRDAFSHLHRLPTDEIYHFYLGDAVELLHLNPDGSATRVVLGPDVLAGQRVQYVVPAGSWHGSRLLDGGEYALMGTTMSPAFEDSNYEHGDAEALLVQYPQQAELIRKLTGPVSYG